MIYLKHYIKEIKKKKWEDGAGYYLGQSGEVCAQMEVREKS